MLQRILFREMLDLFLYYSISMENREQSVSIGTVLFLRSLMQAFQFIHYSLATIRQKLQVHKLAITHKLGSTQMLIFTVVPWCSNTQQVLTQRHMIRKSKQIKIHTFKPTHTRMHTPTHAQTHKHHTHAHVST